MDLFNAGFFWEAHEAWEGPWRKAEHDSLQRAFFQGLIQCAAACLKAVAGRDAERQRLLARAIGWLQIVVKHAGALYMGLNVPLFIEAVQRFAKAPGGTSHAALEMEIEIERIAEHGPS